MAEVYRFDGFVLDLDGHSLRRDGVLVPVEPQVFGVLAHLVRNRARTVTKEELLDAVWGDRFVSESALTSRIKAARRAVGDDGTAQRLIRTVHGRGYQFVGEVEAGAPSAARPLAPAIEVPRTRYARSGDYAIAYQVVGDGPRDLVLVPGFVSHLDLAWELPAMASFFARLAEGRRLILFDKRGTGLSDRVAPDRLPTAEERMDDVRAVLDDVGSTAADVLGISEGGPMAILYAASFPERVGRLVLFGTFAHEPMGPSTDLPARTAQWWGSGTSYGYLAPSWSGDQEVRRFLARFERASATPAAAGMLVDLANRIDVRDVLGAVRVPTLVVHRRGDGVFPVAGARQLAAGIAGARLVELDGDDHLVFVDPEPVLDAVLGFLDEGAAPASPAAAPAERVLATVVVVLAGAGGTVEPADVEAALDAVGAPAGRGGGPRAVPIEGGVLATVDGPARAIRGALALLTGPGAAGQQAAVHTSEVGFEGGRPVGVGVDLAVAAAAAADPGQVVVTRTVRDLVVGSELVFRYRGAERLLDGDRWELYAPSVPVEGAAS